MPGRVGRSLMSSEPGTAARVGSSGTSRGGLLLRAGSRPTGVAQGTPGIGGRPGIRLYAVSPHLRPKPPFLRASSPSGALGYRKARPPPVSSLCRRWCPTRSPLGLATLCQCRFVSSPRVSAARPRRSQYEQRSREPNRRQCRRRRAPWRFGRRITIGSIVTRRPLRFGDPMGVPHYILSKPWVHYPKTKQIVDPVHGFTAAPSHNADALDRRLRRQRDGEFHDRRAVQARGGIFSSTPTPGRPNGIFSSSNCPAGRAAGAFTHRSSRPSARPTIHARRSSSPLKTSPSCFRKR
jgi:hypothetical protein